MKIKKRIACFMVMAALLVTSFGYNTGIAAFAEIDPDSFAEQQEGGYDIISGNWEKPTDVINGKAYKVDGKQKSEGDTYSHKYVKLSLDKASYVDFSYEVIADGTLSIENRSENKPILYKGEVGKKGSNKMLLDKGDYLYHFEGTSKYGFTFNVTPANLGNIELKGTEKITEGGSSYFEYSLVGADPGIKITTVSDGNHTIASGVEVTSGNGRLSSVDGAYKGYIEFQLMDKTVDYSHSIIVNASYEVRPSVPKGFGEKLVEVYSNKAVFEIPWRKDGAATIVQQKQGEEWEDVGIAFLDAKTATVKKLNPDTEYEFRLIATKYGATEEDNISSEPTKTVKVTTGVGTKPVIKSISTSGVKVKYFPSQYVNGYWAADGRWIKGYTIPAYYKTSFKLKVTLKSKVSDYKYLSAFGFGAKGKGNTYTIPVTLKGNLKGKSVSVSVMAYHDKEYKGYSAASKKVKVTVR